MSCYFARYRQITKCLKLFNTLLQVAVQQMTSRKKPCCSIKQVWGFREFFRSLSVSNDTFKDALQALDDHYMPKKNVDYERHMFRQAYQGQHESMKCLCG